MEEKQEIKTEEEQIREKIERKEKVRDIGKEILSWAGYFIAAILIAFVLKTYIIINATVPTGSMESTIMPDDDIFGFRLSYINSTPERGDIIIFKFPDNENERYVKRVIGLPGEKVTIKEGQVFINESTEPLKEEYIKEEWTNAAGPYEFEVPEGCYFVMGDNRNNSYDSRYWTNTYVKEEQIIGKALWIYYPFSRFGAIN
ncbi:MAG: signal peptidase I [Agathobacter sp.]|nr:signal peptidase I [Agathobacter sp.]